MVADASAIYKLIIREEHSKFVEDIFSEETSKGEPIVIPDVAISEVLNVLWVDYIKKKNIDSNTFDSAIVNFDKIIENLDILPGKSLKDIAIKLAASNNTSVYDSMYIAASLFRRTSLLSFDGNMQRVASQLGIPLLFVNPK